MFIPSWYLLADYFINYVDRGRGCGVFDSHVYLFSTELTGIWTKTESWEKEARKFDRTAERSVGGNGKMCHYGMDNTTGVG